MTTFAIVFLAAVALTTATRLWLEWRHLNHVAANRESVPAEFSERISLPVHQKAADYTCAKTRLRMASIAVDAVIVLVLTFGGGLQLLQNISAGWVNQSIAQGLLLIALLVACLTAIETPFSYYRVFTIEERFGFNRMTRALFFLDMAKSALLAALFGLPLAAIVLWLMERAGVYWWIYVWVIWVVFNVFVVMIYPTWIAPFFNKFTPMQDPEIRSRVEQLLERCGFKVKGLLVMDGSRRSAHGNAYFTGFGAAKRIVFFDTLLAALDPPEVEAVLAHELGHFRLHHVLKRLIWLFLTSLGFLALLGYVIQEGWFYASLNISTPSMAIALILFFIVVPYFTFALQPFLAMYSRKHEFEADEYAVSKASARDLIAALIKLYKDNASTLTPDPLHSAFYDSHPPALARIARLQKA
ncbi:MAG TPA: M48 family metallopeptidase [Burkholderiales bacterium]|jgi:STE24 endopeptidase|nr:M48 family metallopeptidase [Burkholderiales bacterium]